MTPEIETVIIGGGPAGIAAAVWCQRLEIKHFMIEKRPTLGGQLENIKNNIMDYPGLPHVTGEDMRQAFIQHLKQMTDHYEINRLIKDLNLSNRTLTLSDQKGHNSSLSFQSLIIATGAAPKRLHILGESELTRQNEVYSASRDAHLFNNKHAVVIGGGDRAFEGAFLLGEAGANVTLIHRSNRFKAQPSFQKRVWHHPNVQIMTHAEVTRIDVNQTGQTIEVIKNGADRKIMDVDGIFIRIGVEPNSHPFQSFIETDQSGYIKTNEVMQTSSPYIYAIGDVCTPPEYSSLSSATGQAMLAAKAITNQSEQN